MIIIENTETYGWEAAIRGMRNPKNSWDKSDSAYCSECSCDCCRHDIDNHNNCNADYSIGPNDHDLMMRLITAGTDHSKFMRMITVTADVTAPLYWWKEYDTYKVGTVANSCSTRHTIHKKEFTMDDFSHEDLYTEENNPSRYKSPCTVLSNLCNCLNYYRERYIETKDKKEWRQLIQLLPSSYNQRRTIQLNYAVLRNIYHARKSHKLDEWLDFCEWIKSLPYSELIMEVSKNEA